MLLRRAGYSDHGGEPRLRLSKMVAGLDTGWIARSSLHSCLRLSSVT